MDRFNLIVIGAGAAGLSAAGGAALLGARVALLERGAMGGECLNTGCVPSKALLHVARVAHTVRTASAHAVSGVAALPAQDLGRAMAYVKAAQARIAPHDSVERMTAMGVTVIRSHARLRSAHEVEATDVGRVLWARHIVVATGSRPHVPDIPGLADAGYLTNETVFDLADLPASLLVIGGGPIGCELGQAFARLGAAVTIVNRAEQLLPREDADVSAALARRLASEGIEVWNGSMPLAVAPRGSRRRVTVRTSAGARAIDVDRILVAAGRRPQVEGLGLEDAGVRFDERGIAVDRTCRTTVRSIWAIGDVTDTFRFTHWGGHQARLVVRNALLPGRRRDARDTLPWTTFTDPEVARVGCSEAEARRQRLPYQAVVVPFEQIDRAVCDGEADGFAKVLVRRGTGKILGAAIVHRHAGELIGTLVLAKRQGISLTRLASLIQVYPTLGDVTRALGDEYLVGSLLPRIRPFASRILAWRRR
jgi:pyruvate/2-oxoglutarate dehydrogenase complex dihydrolipoamide dehydrogenase (E3) component